jgi:ATP-dependent RNA helicase DeaD
MKIKVEIENAIKEMGFVDLTDIQKQTIPLLLQGKDVIGNSHTGTGKTAAFGIPILEMIDFDEQAVQALIITPTRELAVQIKRELTKIAKYIEKCKIVDVYGGEIITRQISALKRKPQIVVGTPGRIIDHIRRKTLKLDNLKYFILDEADEMLKMGFVEDIETIFNTTPSNKQTLMFSATMPKPIVSLAKKYMDKPEVITTVGSDLTNKDTLQYYYKVKRENKTEAIYRILNIYRPNLALIFCNTKAKVDQLTQELIDRKINCDKIHGDLPQTTRLDVLNKFHNGIIDVLIATDVAARGLDIKNVEAVFNYDTPEKADYYIHRIGRTGRIGNLGFAFTLVSRGEMRRIDDIERLTKSTIKRRNVPTYERVMDIRAEKFIEQIKLVGQNENLDKEYITLNNLIQAKIPEDQIIVALLKLLNSENDSSKTKEDINETFKNKSGGNDRRRSSDNSQSARFHLNIGKKAGLTVSDILDFINSNVNIRRNEIRDIAILTEFSFFTVPKSYSPKILSFCKNKKLKGKRVSAEVSRKRR